MTVICKLRKLIEERGLTQAEVAKATKLSPTIIGNLYRNNFKRIDCDTAEALRSFLGLRSLCELYEFQDVEEAQS